MVLSSSSLKIIITITYNRTTKIRKSPSSTQITLNIIRNPIFNEYMIHVIYAMIV